MGSNPTACIFLYQTDIANGVLKTIPYLFNQQTILFLTLTLVVESYTMTRAHEYIDDSS